MKNLIRVMMILSTIFYFGCERKGSDSSVVSLQLPSGGSSASNKIGALACTTCLKGIIVNVDGDDMQKVVASVFHENMDEAGTELSGDITLAVPVGNKRHFQILAVYLDTTSIKTMYIKYGTAFQDVLGESTDVYMTLNSLGEFKSTSIVGRYLTTANTGPTGTVTINLIDPNSGIDMQIGKGEMINGWFNMMGSDNFKLTYILDNGSEVFDGGLKLDDIDFTTKTNKARLYRPTTFYRNVGGSWQSESGRNDIVYGFFGPGADNTSQYVCFEDAYVSLPNLALNAAGTVAASYDSSVAPTGDVYREGGLLSTVDSCDNSTTSIRYTTNRISINVSQLNGNGNDHAKSIEGAFTYAANASFDVSRGVHSASNDLTLYGLPHVFTSLANLPSVSTYRFNGAAIYKKAGATNGGYDNLKCTSDWMSLNGFAQISTSSVVSGDNVIVTMSSYPSSSDGTIVCPTQNGNLQNIGGMYLGDISGL